MVTLKASDHYWQRTSFYWRSTTKPTMELCAPSLIHWGQKVMKGWRSELEEFEKGVTKFALTSSDPPPAKKVCFWNNILNVF